MQAAICSVCGKTFRRNAKLVSSDSDEAARCSACVLNSVCADRAPEEGDFNYARLQSGEMTDEFYALLQEEWLRIEEGRPSAFEPFDQDEDDRWSYDDRDCDCSYCCPDEDE